MGSRGRDGSAGSLDRGRGMRGRDRTPGGRGGRFDDIPRSTNPLLEEFKNSKSRRIEMRVRGARGDGTALSCASNRRPRHKHRASRRHPPPNPGAGGAGQPV